MENSISIRKAFSFGFNKCVDNFGLVFGFIATWLGITFVTLLTLLSVSFLIVLYAPHIEFSQLVTTLKDASTGFAAIQVLQSEPSTFLLMVWSIIAAIIIFALKELFTLGLMRIGLDIYDTGTSTIRSGILPLKLLLRAVAANALVAVITLLGLVLLVIPGIYAALILSFVPLVIIDGRTLSIRKSITLSAEAARPILLKIFFISIIMGISNRLAPISLFIAWLLVTPLLIFAFVYLYRQQMPRMSSTDSVPEYLVEPYL